MEQAQTQPDDEVVGVVQLAVTLVRGAMYEGYFKFN
jgi:hypothetical protein